MNIESETTCVVSPHFWGQVATTKVHAMTGRVVARPRRFHRYPTQTPPRARDSAPRTRNNRPFFHHYDTASSTPGLVLLNIAVSGSPDRLCTPRMCPNVSGGERDTNGHFQSRSVPNGPFGARVFSFCGPDPTAQGQLARCTCFFCNLITSRMISSSFSTEQAVILKPQSPYQEVVLTQHPPSPFLFSNTGVVLMMNSQAGDLFRPADPQSSGNSSHREANASVTSSSSFFSHP